MSDSDSFWQKTKNALSRDVGKDARDAAANVGGKVTIIKEKVSGKIDSANTKVGQTTDKYFPTFKKLFQNEEKREQREELRDNKFIMQQEGWMKKTLGGAKGAASAVGGATKSFLQPTAGTGFFTVLVIAAHAAIMLSMPELPNIGTILSEPNYLLGLLFHKFFLMQIIIALIAAFFVYGGSLQFPDKLKLFGEFMIIAALAWFGPVLLANALNNGDIAGFGNMSVIISILFQPWMVVILEHHRDKFAVILSAFWMIAVMIFVIMVLVATFALGTEFTPEYGTMYTPAELWTGLKGAVNQAANSTVNVVTNTGNQVKQTASSSVSGLTSQITGNVDTSQGLPLGVFVTEMQPKVQYVPGQDSLIVFATIRSRSLAKDQGVIQLSCQGGVKETTYANGVATTVLREFPTPALNPTSIPLTYSGNYQDIRKVACDFGTGYGDLVPAGRAVSGNVNITATYDFKTMAYIPLLFMERSKIVALQGQAPSAENPATPPTSARYTPGPLRITILSGAQPYDATLASQDQLGFSVTVANDLKPQGSVTQWKSFQFYVPKQFHLSNCVPALNPAGTWSENPDYSVYDLPVGNIDFPPIEQYFNVLCNLGGNGLGTFTFFTNIDYSYKMIGTTSVTLRSDQPLPATNTGTTGTSTSGGTGTTTDGGTNYPPPNMQSCATTATDATNTYCQVTVSYGIWNCRYDGSGSTSSGFSNANCYLAIPAANTNFVCDFTAGSPSCKLCPREGTADPFILC